MARPVKVIDVELLKKLASIMCTNEEMAHILGVSKDTLERRYAAVIKEAKDTGKMTLRRWQWEACKKGNTALLIWMGKQHLGQSDKQDASVSVSQIKINKTEEKL